MQNSNSMYQNKYQISDEISHPSTPTNQPKNSLSFAQDSLLVIISLEKFVEFYNSRVRNYLFST